MELIIATGTTIVFVLNAIKLGPSLNSCNFPSLLIFPAGDINKFLPLLISFIIYLIESWHIVSPFKGIALTRYRSNLGIILLKKLDNLSKIFNSFPVIFVYNGGMKKMVVPLKKSDHKFTYKEYCSWPEDERWELIDGIAYNMSPAPSSKHQRISGYLYTGLSNFLKQKSCEVFSAPFDVMLPNFPIENEEEIDTIVQPDISVICNPTKIVDRGCLGAPDLIVEILSPSTSKKDLNEKFQLYRSEKNH